jgi:type II secretory pathway pseudopilin PulG
MFRNDTNRSPRRTGLTLIELLVVLTILIALAALVVPMMPGMLSRSHDASSATNLSEISRIVQTYNQLYFDFPNNLDNLVEAGNGTSSGGALLGTLAGGGNLAGQLVTHPLTAPELSALNAVGITTVANLTGTDPSPGNDNWSPTFFPYVTLPSATTPSTTTLASGTTVAVLSPTALNLVGVPKLGLSLTGTYVVLGFGIANTAVGKVIQEAPVHFPDQPTISPATTYQRYGLLFKVSDTAAGIPAITSAQFVGTVCLLNDGIETAGDHIQDFFNRAAQQQ